MRANFGWHMWLLAAWAAFLLFVVLLRMVSQAR